ncbi:MAG TPA: LytTR family DNA-binding domain-containing protein [Puia sp.]|nr:LytTR family DNA-binding domain-containing protein [Puia sp.]
MINCVIVDDEPLAREGMSNYVRDVDFLHLAGACENPLELTKLLEQRPVDLLFLDIQMPKMNGLDFLRLVQNPPIVIITTAYPTYAIEGFQLNVLDYLLKPITFDRFFKSVTKARDYYHLVTRGNSSAAEPAAGYFFIRCGSKYEKIYLNQILYIEGMQNYITLHTEKGKYVTLLYLKNLEENLDAKAFIRVHKSYIVSIDKIEAIEGNEILIQTHRIPMSRNHRDQVIQRVVAGNLWDKIKFS